MNFLAALLILVHALLAGAFEVPAPAPHGVTVSPATPAPAGVATAPSRGASPGGAHAGVPAQPPAAPVTVAMPTPEPEPEAQRPDERIGRELDCADGTVGVVLDAAGDVSCP